MHEEVLEGDINALIGFWLDMQSYLPEQGILQRDAQVLMTPANPLLQGYGPPPTETLTAQYRQVMAVGHTDPQGGCTRSHSSTSWARRVRHLVHLFGGSHMLLRAAFLEPHIR